MKYQCALLHIKIAIWYWTRPESRARGGTGIRRTPGPPGQTASSCTSFSREVAPRNNCRRDGAIPSALASRPSTASFAPPSCGLARTFIRTRPSAISIPSTRAPGVTCKASRPCASAAARSASTGGSSSLGFATQRRHVPPRQLAIARGLEADLLDLGLVLRAIGFRRAAGPDFARRNVLAGAEQGARGQHRAFADPAIVHRHRAHADEGAILQRAAVDHRHVPDHAILADDGRAAIGIGARALDMEDAPVLHVRPCAHLDAMDVAAQHA